MQAVKIRKIGNSLGVVIPKEVLARMKVGEGETLYFTDALDGSVRLTPVDEEFAAQMEQHFRQRLGRMRLTSTRHAYPLVGVYPRYFVAERFALVGDAAVGMHPVTAHGFNLGLLGQDLLSRAMLSARATGADIANPALLATYQRELRRATRPLYLATYAITRLYTDDRLPARVLRRAALAAGTGLRPLRRAMLHGLSQAGDSRSATFPLLGLLKAITR